MNNFKDRGPKKRGKGFGGKPKFDGPRESTSRAGGSTFGGKKPSARPADSYKAECSKCHKACTLPFSPNSTKPVFCSDCFAKKNAESSQADGGYKSVSRVDYAKPPRDERPARHDRPLPSAELASLRRQLETIEARLNRILDIINPPTPAKKAVEVVEGAEVAATKVAPKKVTAKKAVKKVPTKKAVAKKAIAKKVTKKAAVKKVVKKKK